MNRLDLTRRLIAIDSESSLPSRPIADDVSNMLEGAGFRIEQHVYNFKGVDKVNVVAIKGGDGQPELAFSGHLDTMPHGEDEWQSDPLKLTERDGLFYGRGTCDMKGFIALAMDVGMRIPAHELKRPFGLILTSDEEVGCIGAQRLISQWSETRSMPLAKHIVIGEPTDLVPLNLHKGYVYLKVLLRGKSVHSSIPHMGRNVISRAAWQVIMRLNEMGEGLEAIRDLRFEVPFPTLNIGVIDSGKDAKKNTVAKNCTIELDVRPLPGQDVDEVIQAITQHVAPNGELNGIEVEVQLGATPTPPFDTPIDSRIVRKVSEIFGNTPSSAPFNTEAGVLNHSGCSCVICGPGSIGQAHQPNEFIDGKYFSAAVTDKYEKLVRTFCCTTEEESER